MHDPADRSPLGTPQIRLGTGPVTSGTARIARCAPLVRRPAAVIFDMDGLMLDTEPLAARAWGEAAAALGVDFDMTLAQAMIGRNFADCATMLRARYAAPYPFDALLGSWHTAYDAIVAREGLVLKPGLRELLDLRDIDFHRANAGFGDSLTRRFEIEPGCTRLVNADKHAG